MLHFPIHLDLARSVLLALLVSYFSPLAGSASVSSNDLEDRIWRTDCSYDAYRSLLLRNGWKPIGNSCISRPYPEVCYGSGRGAQGTASWLNPRTGERYGITIRGCATKSGYCLMPDIKQQ
ncbi:MAG: hypothetical protein VKM17_06200 [Cyanobacteriota bacterium]|nr:hypothetical protein [Cyanobacteriota bacterium]